MWFLVLAIAAITLLSFVAQYWWFLDYFCHFRLQYAYFLLFAFVVFALTRKLGKVALVIVLLLINVATFIPFYQTTQPPSEVTKTLKLVSANVSSSNDQQGRAIEFIREVDPDFVLLFEANEDWSNAVDSIAAEYPYKIREIKAGNFSKVILSRYPLGPATRKPFGRTSIYAVLTECEVNGRTFLLIASHLLPPYTRSYFQLRNEHLYDLMNEVVAYDGTAILAGDLNITPWSPHFQSALTQGGLVDSRLGFGLQPTWPSFLPGMRIPIDHVLATPDVTIHSVQRGPFIGSDHLPLFVEFSLDEPDEQ